MPRRAERLWLRVRPGAVADWTLPDFLGIGAQKAGTTWLSENLRRHPEIFLPDRKELHFFDKQWHRPLARYARHFAAGAGRIKGEVTPAYGILDAERIRFIRRVLPDLRLMLILRNPIDRAWSHALMDVALRKGRNPQTVPESEYRTYLNSHMVTRRSDYAAILDRWLAVFPGEQLLLGFFEEIQERPRDLLSRVFRHVGASTDVDWNDFPLDRVILPTVSPERRRAGARPERADGTRPLNSARHPCPPRLHAWLCSHYAPQLVRLEQRLGEPVARWRASPQ